VEISFTILTELLHGKHNHKLLWFNQPQTILGSKPNAYSTPVIENNHLEINKSEVIGGPGIEKYHSFIGSFYNG
jgi:hypothetical protein